MKLPGLTLSKKGVLLNEPVLAAFIAVWIVQQAGTYVVGRLHWIDQDAFDTLSNKLVAVVSLIVLLGLGWLVRRVVTPAWKMLQREADQFGLDMPDIDVTEDEADAIIAQNLAPATGPPAERRHAQPTD